MNLPFRSLSTLLGGAVLVAFACFTASSCQPTGGDYTPIGNGGNSAGGHAGSGSGGSSNGGVSGGTVGRGGSAGTASSTGGSTATASGGASATGGKASAGGATGSGGATSPGGTTGSGGSASTGGATPTGGSATPVGGTGGSTGVATCTTDLMTLRTGADNSWIPTTPPSCSVQGSVYAYGDGSTCTSALASACGAGAAGCCISGTTVVDATSKKWGCGLGLDLNSSGGTTATKSAYAGAAKGFKITIAGTIATGQKIRIMYGSTAADPTAGTAPYKEVSAVGTYSVLFSDARCPAWATTAAQCAPVSGDAAFSLKVQIPGGSVATDSVGAFSNVCITSVVPITN